MATYSDIRQKIKTGDIVLFSGKGHISAGIKWITQSKWSHVGMALRLPKDWDFVLLWESTTLSNLADLESGKARKGVQLVPLSERLRLYDGEASVRLLEIERTDKMREDLRAFRSKVKDKPYERDQIELLKAAYDGPFGRNVEDLSSLFCSELVAETYQQMGLLAEDKPSNEYTPRDFSDKAKEPLSLMKGTLSAEIPVTFP